MENKEIHFIDSGYDELFRIPDGGRIKITTSDGAEHLRYCKYLDEYHFSLKKDNDANTYGEVFHICQFAEFMERNGNTYEPIIENAYQFEAASSDDCKQFSIREESGCIGIYTGNFRSKNLFLGWSNKDVNLQTDAFQKEVCEVLNYLRLKADAPILKNVDNMRRICSEYKPIEETRFDKDAYMFKSCSKDNTYLLCCYPNAPKPFFHLFCYNTEKLQQYKDVQFAEQTYGEITADKFFKNDDGFTEVYYNPDATAGGQLVYNTISSDLIREAAQNSKTREDFFSYISDYCKQSLIDAGTPEFRGNLDSFVKRRASFNGCTDKTMEGLKKSVGITPEKKRKREDMER